MTRRVAQLALRLYPLAFRRRYGAEMRALVDQTPARVAIVLDLIRGALAAHAQPPGAVAARLGPADRLRASTSGVLACWVAFAAAGFGFYKTTEDAPFTAAGHAHRLLGDAHLAIGALAVMASAAVVLGALPLIAAALAHARRQRAVRLVVSLPVLAVIAFACLTGLLVLIAHSQPAGHASAAARGAFVAWVLAGLACGAVCVAASRAALFAVPVGPRRLLTALACGTLVTLAMLAMTLATAVYAVALPLDAAHLAAEPNGPFGLISTGVSLGGQAIVMVLAGMLAAAATRRGWVAAHRLASHEA